MEASLIIATYNWPAALALCLNSVLRQSVMPAEVIIADDGSRKETQELVDSFRQKFPVPLVHVWHEDDGFKLAQIRNKAAAIAKDYIIQIDGDLILHKDFVKNHVEAATKGHYICGSRVIVNQQLTNRLLQSNKGTVKLGIFSQNISNRLNGMYFKSLSNLINKLINYKNTSNIRGCNMSYWRSDFIAVNGYNEAFVGWGREDSDLVIRFEKLGLKRRFFKFQGIVYHLYHKENDRFNLANNDLILLNARNNKEYTCKLGVNQYL